MNCIKIYTQLRERGGLDIGGGSFFTLSYLDARVSFPSDKDEGIVK